MNLETPKVSVVVPIYGVEKYLRQCVDSILAQTLKDIEVILVDDGSPDACPRIVDEYAARDPRVVPVHQPNGGYGSAVNHGIRLARGEYIGIIESDDWIEPTMYEKLYDAAKKNDVVLAKAGFFVYNSKLPQGCQSSPWIVSHQRQDLRTAPDGAFSPLADYPVIFNFHASLWSNLYRADFVKQIPLIESKSAAYQDFPFIMECLARCGKMCVVKEYLVHYRMEPGQNSSTMGASGEKLLRMAEMSIEGRKVLEKYGVLSSIKEYFFFHAFIANYGFFMRVDDKTRKIYAQKLQTLFAPLANDASFGYRCFNDYEKKFVLAILNEKRPKRSWKHEKRKFFRLNIRRERIIFKLGRFECVVPLRFAKGEK